MFQTQPHSPTTSAAVLEYFLFCCRHFILSQSAACILHYLSPLLFDSQPSCVLKCCINTFPCMDVTPGRGGVTWATVWSFSLMNLKAPTELPDSRHASPSPGFPPSVRPLCVPPGREEETHREWHRHHRVPGRGGRLALLQALHDPITLHPYPASPFYRSASVLLIIFHFMDIFTYYFLVNSRTISSTLLCIHIILCIETFSGYIYIYIYIFHYTVFLFHIYSWTQSPFWIWIVVYSYIICHLADVIGCFVLGLAWLYSQIYLH